MNTTHLLAWITCLGLAFFACVMAVRNAGRMLAMGNQMESMRKDISAMEQRDRGEITKESARIRKSVTNIIEELRNVRRDSGEKNMIGEELKDELKGLERELEVLRESLKPRDSGEE